MECYICSLFPSVRKINVSTLTSEGALGIDNGRYEAFHLEVTGSALPHVGRHHQYLPSAPPQPSAQCEMGWSQFWVLRTDVWVPAGSLGCFSRKWDGPAQLSLRCDSGPSLQLRLSTIGELDLLPRLYNP